MQKIYKIVLVITLGVTTGVGGGVLRDILVSRTPFILKKHIYAIASIIGSLLYYFLRINETEEYLRTIIPILVIIVIRLLSTKYRWKLPKIEIE